MSVKPLKAIVLAAGKGTRMRTDGCDLPKVMRLANGKPLLHYVLASLDFIAPEDTILVVGYKKENVIEAFPGYGDIIPLVEGYDGDYDDPLLSSNPGNNVVRNNMHYLTYQMNSKDSEFSYQVLNMGIVENNLRFNDFDHLQIPGVESGDYTLSEDAEAYKNGFEKIPFEEIGRITEE